MDIAESLVQLEDRLREQRVPIVDVLAPGIEEDQVRAALAPLGMEPPGELITWFAWHNGITEVEPQSFGQTLLNRHVLSVAQAVAEWHWLQPGPEPWQWNPTWLPFGSSTGMWRYAVDCTPPQAETATVRLASPDEGYFDESRRASVVGLASVVSWWIEALDRGWMRWAEDPGEWQDPGRVSFPPGWGISGLI